MLKFCSSFNLYIFYVLYFFLFLLYFLLFAYLLHEEGFLHASQFSIQLVCFVPQIASNTKYSIYSEKNLKKKKEEENSWIISFCGQSKCSFPKQIRASAINWQSNQILLLPLIKLQIIQEKTPFIAIKNKKKKSQTFMFWRLEGSFCRILITKVVTLLSEKWLTK